MGNAIKNVKWHITNTPGNISDKEAKERLNNAIDDFLRERILLAAQAIYEEASRKIADTDVILVYGWGPYNQGMVGAKRPGSLLGVKRPGTKQPGAKRLDKFGMKKVCIFLFLFVIVVMYVLVQYGGSGLPLPLIVNHFVLFNSSINTGKVQKALVKTTRTNNTTTQTRFSFTPVILSNVKLEPMPVRAPARNVSGTNNRPYPQDLMKVGPFKFLKNYKNPCFKETDGNMSCLPYFYLAGFPKSGTTDLSARITNHPEVSSLVKKEPHWITRGRFKFNAEEKKYVTIETYLRMFSRAAMDIRASGNSSYHPKVVGDCSACTLWDNFSWKMLKENNNATKPAHTVPDFIHHLYPQTKIIVILRNPIDRLYSGYLYFTKTIKSAIDFHQRVKKAIIYFKECFRLYSEQNCLFRPPDRKTDRIYIGLYYYYIKDFMRVFPRNQMLILKTEDYSINMAKNLKKVFAFLEIAPLGADKMSRIVNDIRQRNTRRKPDSAVGDMMPETRKLLHTFYKPYNAKLEELLGRKFWD